MITDETDCPWCGGETGLQRVGLWLSARFVAKCCGREVLPPCLSSEEVESPAHWRRAPPPGIPVPPMARPWLSRLTVAFKWYDFWVGAYWDRQERVLYVCPLPTLCISVDLA